MNDCGNKMCQPADAATDSPDGLNAKSEAFAHLNSRGKPFIEIDKFDLCYWHNLFNDLGLKVLTQDAFPNLMRVKCGSE